MQYCNTSQGRGHPVPCLMLSELRFGFLFVLKPHAHITGCTGFKVHRQLSDTPISVSVCPNTSPTVQKSPVSWCIFVAAIWRRE